MLNMGRHALCKYPLLVSESLHDNNLLGGHHLCRFSFSAGGQFVQDSSLGVESIIGVTHIFAALVGFTNKYITNNKSTLHVRISQCIPDLINKFAEGSRSSGGERLKKRAVRHAFDLKTDPLDCKAIGAIFKQGATGTGLVITHTVSPSFRQDTKYAVCVAITADDLLAAECNCKAGCSCKDKHICVHILPVLLQLLTQMGVKRPKKMREFCRNRTFPGPVQLDAFGSVTCLPNKQTERSSRQECHFHACMVNTTTPVVVKK